MKKIFTFVMALCFAFSIMSCTGTGKAVGATDSDSIEVVTDTVDVDSIAVDSVVVAE
jgi:hypothetical protein